MWLATALTPSPRLRRPVRRQASGASERQALDRLRESVERIDARRFPIMEDFIWTFSVTVEQVLL
ncbi:MAG: hypothetical protein VYA34_03980 [Myxococcota bacterium]|nr:hypothetical protein [Myxococcota bacterium]